MLPGCHRLILASCQCGWAYRQKGCTEEALAEFKKAQQVEDTPLQLCEIALMRRPAINLEARRVLHEVIESSKRKH